MEPTPLVYRDGQNHFHPCTFFYTAASNKISIYGEGTVNLPYWNMQSQILIHEAMHDRAASSPGQRITDKAYDLFCSRCSELHRVAAYSDMAVKGLARRQSEDAIVNADNYVY